ncbi:hypothetical protein RAZWK3B_14584 [Roseobacter sp. AzwK-3b]|nr:hypothetical protein RAZWK3B_14584 [Roseobacter sp. AzwK-3b]
MPNGRTTIIGPRPPSFVSKATLAAELDVSEATVDSYVQRGLLRKPIRLGGSVRWCWAEVEADLRQVSVGREDQFMIGLDNV